MCLLAPIAKATVLLQLWGLDFTGNHVLTDAESFPKAPPANVLPAVEFSNGTWKTQTIAYTRGSSITANVTIKNPRAESFTGTLNVNGVLYIPQARYDGWSLFPMVLPTTTPTINLAIPAGGTQTFTLNFVGFPTVVSFGELNIDWNAQGSWGGGASTHAFGPVPGDYDFFGWVYGLFSTPVDLQTIPWVEVLDESCTYATGASTQSELTELLTRGLFYGSGREYDSSHPYYVNIKPLGQSVEAWFNLNRWYHHPNPTHPSSRLVDCQDVAAINSLLHYSQGLFVTPLRMETDVIPWSPITTNQVCPIGKDPMNIVNYQAYTFQFHNVIKYGNSVSDAALAFRYDLLAYDFRDVPVNWDESGYWQTSFFATLGLVSLPAFPCPALLTPMPLSGIS